MQKKLALDKAALVLSSKATPVLFLDTCVMLDIFRLVERADSFTPFKFYLQLVDRIKNGDVCVVYNETVEKEYSYNAANVVREQRAKIKNLNNKWNALRSMKEKKDVSHKIELSADKIIHSAETTLRYIQQNALIIKDYDAALWSSYDVVLRHVAPATRESQFKDACIFKTCMDLGKKSGREIVFCTTNTKDYCDDTKKNVHPDIKSQADANNVVVALNLGDAYGHMFHPL